MNYREEKRKTSEMTYLERPIVVRGGGDLATGTILMLSRAGYPVIILETECPTAIRREAAFSEAVRYGTKTVENTVCRKVDSPEEALAAAAPLSPVLLVDGARHKAALHPVLHRRRLQPRDRAHLPEREPRRRADHRSVRFKGAARRRYSLHIPGPPLQVYLIITQVHLTVKRVRIIFLKLC